MSSNDTRQPLDSWTASSLLQKAIRRGEVEHSLRAARALHRLRGAGIWRRLLLIACEDIGIGALDLLQLIAQLTAHKTRRSIGSEDELIEYVVTAMASAPKDRSSDYLICAAMDHPGHDAEREAIGAMPTNAQIAMIFDPTQPIVRRAIATWYASGMSIGVSPQNQPELLAKLLAAFEEKDFPSALSEAIRAAAQKTKEPIVVMLPLLWALSRETGESGHVEHIELPPSLDCSGVPAWTFDKHTRLGKRAMRQLIRECPAVDKILSKYVPDFRASAVIEMACFYSDASPVASRFVWTHSSELEILGLETDMTAAGCPKEGVMPIFETVRDNVDQLNDIRCRLRADEEGRS